MAGGFSIWGTDQELILWYKGLVDIDAVYAACKDWFDSRKYHFYEHYYKQKRPTPVGEEAMIRWTAFINRTEYIRLKMDILWRMWDIEPKEVMKAGKKHRLFSGRIRVTLRAEIVTDFKDYYERTAMHSMMRDFMDKYVIRTKLTNLSTVFEMECHELMDLIRKKMGTEIQSSAFVGKR